jgi:hypothetical protein
MLVLHSLLSLTPRTAVMSGLFHDTLFAVVVRAVLGPTYFPHLDEINPPNIYQKTTRRVKSSETTIGRGMKDEEVSRGGSFTTFSELEAQTTSSVALQSSLTLGRGVEDHDDLLNARGHRLEAFEEQGSHATQSMALQTSLTLRPLAEDQDKPPNFRGHGFGAFDEREAHATQPMVLQSSLTIVAPEEQPKSLKEEGVDSLLVTWNGPDDPEVR